MTRGETMRIVWYNGRPYGITTMPFGPSKPTTDWHILLDGGWHQLFPSAPRDAEDWTEVERRVLAWLAQRDLPIGPV